MKTGAIIDAFSSGSLLAPEFKKKGYQLIHVRSAKVPDPAHINAPFTKEDFILDIYEEDKTKLVEILKKHNVSFVIPGIEPSVELADFLNEQLQLPSNGTTLSHARRNKYEMVELIKQAGLHTAKQIKTASVDEMLQFAKSLPTYKFVLKPLRNAGSEHVFIVENETDAIHGFHEIMNNKTHFGEENTAVCVQEFLEGDEYVVNTVSADGQIVVTDVWKHVFSPVNDLPVFYDYDILLSPEDQSVKKLKEYTVKAVAALGIKWGPAHPEIMDTPEGPAVVEINSRMQGAGVPKITKIGLGRSQVEFTVAAYTDLEEFKKLATKHVTLNKHCLWIILLSHTEGKLKSLEKISLIEKLPSFAGIVLGIKTGQMIQKTLNLSTTPGYVFLTHADKEQLMKDYQKIRELENNGLFEVE